jgi:hypothetical protein
MEGNTMKKLICSAVLIGSISIANMAFAQGRGAGAGPAAGPAAGGQRGPGAPPASGTTGGQARGGRGDAPRGAAGTGAGRGAPNRVGTELSNHPALSAKLQTLLPSGTNVNDASAGFKNLGQFVAAVHVSKDLNIPFDQLKTKMLTDKESLGDAVHALKPDVTKDAAIAAVKKAEAQAKEDTKNPS